MQVRTRFAPSPTGYMHIGNLRSALYAYLFAKKQNGVFLLRIEDTDQDRYVEGAVEIVYDTLKSVGILWDEGPDIGGAYGPYVQSERKAVYAQYAEQLLKTGHAYRCFCTKEELEQRREAAAARGETFKYDKHCLHISQADIDARLRAGVPYVVRQNIPEAGETTFSDLLFGDITVENSSLDDNVLMKADGMPTYNFANVVDDHLMQITHVMRGMEYLSSTPKYNLLYRSFGWEIPAYIHMPPIMKDARNKLSKRTGDASFQDLLKKGYLKEAVLNYIALLGWSPGDDREKFTLAELIEAFDIKGMSKSPAIFDAAKLTWLNAEYIRALDTATFTEYAQPYYAQAGISHMDTEILARILQPRVEVFSQIPDMVDFLSALDEAYDVELFTNKKSKTDPVVSAGVLDMVIPAIEALNDLNEVSLHDLLIGMAQAQGMKNGTLLWPVRIAMAGRTVTPGGAIEIAMLLGKEETLRRLRFGREKLR
ncbi:glutamate--tRNA ligase [Christensenellaceae bacterium OttesenSCG-928-L17]|nr:glutamate--tRNA ligase [Christensenellaceae bacterium OttesenSCG-928-L17]